MNSPRRGDEHDGTMLTPSDLETRRAQRLRNLADGRLTAESRRLMEIVKERGHAMVYICIYHLARPDSIAVFGRSG